MRYTWYRKPFPSSTTWRGGSSNGDGGDDGDGDDDNDDDDDDDNDNDGAVGRERAGAPWQGKTLSPPAPTMLPAAEDGDV